MEIDEERNVAVVAEPVHEPVDVLAGRLRAAGPGPARRRLPLVKLLESLMEVRELAGEHHGRIRQRGVAGLAVGLGDGRR